MRLLDNLKNVLGGKKDDGLLGSTKAPSQVLKENGIDPSGLKFAFGADGTVTVSGTVQQATDQARIKDLLLGISGIKKVVQNLSVAQAGQAAEAAESVVKEKAATKATEAAPKASEAAGSEGAKSYTVQSGDTLWKIAKQFYGEGSQYMKIFEANKNLLKDPDHIFPGQELKIPD